MPVRRAAARTFGRPPRGRRRLPRGARLAPRRRRASRRHSAGRRPGARVDRLDQANNGDPVGATLGVERRDERCDQDPWPAADDDPPGVGARPANRVQVRAQGDPEVDRAGRRVRAAARRLAPGGSESELPGRRREASRHAVSRSGAGPQVEPRHPGMPAAPSLDGRARDRGRATGWIRGNRRAGPDPADEIALGRQLLIGGRDRDPSHAQVGRETPDPGQPGPRLKTLLVDRRPELVLHLAVERNVAGPIEGDRCGRRHDCG